MCHAKIKNKRRTRSQIKWIEKDDIRFPIIDKHFSSGMSAFSTAEEKK